MSRAKELMPVRGPFWTQRHERGAHAVTVKVKRLRLWNLIGIPDAARALVMSLGTDFVTLVHFASSQSNLKLLYQYWEENYGYEQWSSADPRCMA
jgi:hypothetical protein